MWSLEKTERAHLMIGKHSERPSDEWWLAKTKRVDLMIGKNRESPSDDWQKETPV